MATTHRRPRAAGAALLAVLWAAAAHAADLSAAERDGKRIFLEGESPSGQEIRARVGQDGTALPATTLPCGSCHGRDGLGRAEGGALPPPITWSELAKPYGHVHPGGRRHPRFDERSLARAVGEGIDPAGNPLDATMPRYEMSPRDLASLAAYLKKLERDLDPGVSDREVRLGTVLPVRGASAPVGEDLRAILEAYFAHVNEGGGLHGRRVRLEVAGYDADRETGIEAARRLLAGRRVLALVSGFFPAAEAEVFAAAERDRVPVIAPFEPLGAAATTPAGVFHLVGGVREEAVALVEHAAARLPERPPVAIVRGEGPRLAGAADAAAAQLRKRGFQRVEVAPPGEGPRALAARLREAGAAAVLLLEGDAEVAAFVAAADALGWAPMLLVPGSLAARAVASAPAAFHGRAVLAVPTLPAAERTDGAAELAALEGRARLERGRHRAVRAHAFAAAALASEALRRAGGRPSREALVEALEATHGFDLGVVPPISYGPGRRVGASGAYVVALDPSRGGFVPVGGFVAVE